MVLAIPLGAAKVLSALSRAGFDAYVVGGCVRDSLLGLPPKDWDIAAASPPETTQSVLRAAGIRTIATGLRHGTVTADLGDEGRCEVTTFRVDGPYADHRRPTRVDFVADLRADLARRDFTMNAMAYRPGEGLVDPFGGQAALRAGEIACVGDPAARFEEDALRILRALRFAATYGFSLAQDTAAALHACAPLLRSIAGERVREELSRLLSGPAAAGMLLAYRDVLAVPLPETAAYSDEAYAAAVRAASSLTDPAAQMALLLRPLGPAAEAVLTRLRFDRKTVDRAAALLRWHDAPLEATLASARRWLARLGRADLERFLDAESSQALAVGDNARALQCQNLRRAAADQSDACTSLRALAVNGSDLLALGVPPGKAVGAALSALLSEVVDGTLENAREALLSRALTWVPK